MDSELLKKGLDYTKKKKRWLLALGALGFTGYSAYRIYHLPPLVNKRKNLLKLLSALVSVAEMVSDSAETIGIVSNDLKQFIQSDSDKIPNSLKQISKITQSEEFSESVTTITKALTLGVLRGYRLESMKNGASGFSDRVINSLFSDAGSGFASVVVGSFARNLIMAFYSYRQHNKESNFDGFSDLDHHHTVESYHSILRWVEVACDDKVRELIGDCIQLFVSTAVSVYLDKTMEINTCDDIFSGLTNPKHETRVRDMLVSVCNSAVETFVHTSHQEWNTSSLDDSNLKVDFGDSLAGNDEANNGMKLISTTLQAWKLNRKNQDNGWMGKMSSTLAVPRNKKFVLDMTGKVTFETVRLFLEFILEKLSECVKRSVDVVHQEVVDRGLETVRYVSSKSSAVATVCLTICLHILNGPWLLDPY